MVYEHLPSSTVEVFDFTDTAQAQGRIKMHYTKFATGILASCKFLKTEAEPFFIKAYKMCVFETTQDFHARDERCSGTRACILYYVLVSTLSTLYEIAESMLDAVLDKRRWLAYVMSSC